MKHKTDITLAATSARSYNRHWRAKRISWNAIGKIRYLFDGAIEYMDLITLCYPQEKFNELRKALGFKQDSELVELIVQSDAFRMVWDKESGQLVAFMTPLVPDRFVPTEKQTIEEPKIEAAVFDCKANAIANLNDRDKISENLSAHKKGINMKVLLAGNVPKFHAKPNDEAEKRVCDLLWNVYYNHEEFSYYFGEFIYHYKEKYGVDDCTAHFVLFRYLDHRLSGHMACRVGIENWPVEAIKKWLKNYFGAKKLGYVVTDAKEVYDKIQKTHRYTLIV